MDILDQKIAELQQIVDAAEAELNELRKTSNVPWVTTCVLSSITPQPLSLMSLTLIAKCAAEVNSKTRQMEEACNELEIPLSDEILKIDGFTRKEWLADFKKAVRLAQVREKAKQLDLFKSKLNSLISAERRRELEIASLETLITQMK